MLTFDGCFERLGYGDHNVRSENPKNVINEKTAKQYASRDHVIQMKQFHAVDGKGYPK